MTDTTPTPPKRWCYYVPHNAGTPNGFIPSVVEENEPGHAPLMGQGDLGQPWYWGSTYEEATAICEEQNLKLGITPEEAARIVTSSMAASNRQEAREQELSDRYDNLRRGQ